MTAMFAQIVISPESGISLVVLVAVISAVSWLLGKFSSIEGRVRSTAAKLDKAWMQEDMKDWSRDLDDVNDSLKVPDPNRNIEARRMREARERNGQG